MVIVVVLVLVFGQGDEVVELLDKIEVLEVNIQCVVILYIEVLDELELLVLDDEVDDDEWNGDELVHNDVIDVLLHLAIDEIDEIDEVLVDVLLDDEVDDIDIVDDENDEIEVLDDDYIDEIDEIVCFVDEIDDNLVVLDIDDIDI